MTEPNSGGGPTTSDSAAVPVPTGTPLEIVRVRTGMFGVQDDGDTSGYGGLVKPVVFPPATNRPYGSYFDALADTLTEALTTGTGSDAGADAGGDAGQAGADWDEAIEKVVVDRDELTLHVRRQHLVRICQVLRDHPDLRFELCASVSGVHYPYEAGRELRSLYHLLSITHNRRIRLEVGCPDADPHIPSVVEVYPTADWHERETWDFFGIIYDGHPALTRIQMPDDWPGHPQRKDYPLGGIPVEYKGATIPPPDTRRAYT
jgi:NADH-quinone oxidoreductase subunit C